MLTIKHSFHQKQCHIMRVFEEEVYVSSMSCMRISKLEENFLFFFFPHLSNMIFLINYTILEHATQKEATATPLELKFTSVYID